LAADTGGFQDQVHFSPSFRLLCPRRQSRGDADHGVMPRKERGYADSAAFAECSDFDYAKIMNSVPLSGPRFSMTCTSQKSGANVRNGSEAAIGR
jgi:hypothetical protein